MGGGGGRSGKLIFKTKNPSLKKIFFWGRGEGEMNFFDEIAMNPFFFGGGGGMEVVSSYFKQSKSGKKYFHGGGIGEREVSKSEYF